MNKHHEQNATRKDTREAAMAAEAKRLRQLDREGAGHRHVLGPTSFFKIRRRNDPTKYLWEGQGFSRIVDEAEIFRANHLGRIVQYFRANGQKTIGQAWDIDCDYQMIFVQPTELKKLRNNLRLAIRFARKSVEHAENMHRLERPILDEYGENDLQGAVLQLETAEDLLTDSK